MKYKDSIEFTEIEKKINKMKLYIPKILRYFDESI